MNKHQNEIHNNIRTYLFCYLRKEDLTKWKSPKVRYYVGDEVGLQTNRMGQDLGQNSKVLPLGSRGV